MQATSEPARSVALSAPLPTPLPPLRVARWRRTALVGLVVGCLVAFVGGSFYVAALSLVALSRRPVASRLALRTRVDDAVQALRGLAGGNGGEVRAPSFLLAALPDWTGSTPFSILLLGIDQRDDEAVDDSDPGRTDTMMLLRIDPRGKSAALISLPRDLWVEIPGMGQGRINSAYTYGELRRVPGGGPALAKQTVERNFGLAVDYYALVNFHGFEQLVDALGGIVIDVDRPLKDDEYPTDDYGIERVYIPPGLQLMDGRLALKYARSRHSDNDFGRMRRQQRVLFAARQRVLQLNMVAQAPALIGQVHDMIRTDLGVGELLRLAKLGQQLDSGRIGSLLIDASMVREADPRAGRYELLWDKERIRRAVSGLLAGLNPEQAARIEVLNGSGRMGLAADTAKYLMNLGYEVVRIDDAERSDYRESVLEVAPERRALAEDLAATLQLSRWQPRTWQGDANAADVRLIVGREFQLPQPHPLDATAAEPIAPPLRRTE